MCRLSECADLLVFVVAACLTRRSTRRADQPECGITRSFVDPMSSVVSSVDHVADLVDAAHASPYVFTSAVVLLERAVASRVVVLNPENVRVLYTVAVTLAIKWHEDFFFANTHYAALSGASLKEFNRIEREFLAAIDYNVAVSDEVLARAENRAIADARASCLWDALEPEVERCGLSLETESVLVLADSFDRTRDAPPFAPGHASSALLTSTRGSSPCVDTRVSTVVVSKRTTSLWSSPTCAPSSWDYPMPPLRNAGAQNLSPKSYYSPIRLPCLYENLSKHCTPGGVPMSGFGLHCRDSAYPPVEIEEIATSDADE